jgi:hypothetical protein
MKKKKRRAVVCYTVLHILHINSKLYKGMGQVYELYNCILWFVENSMSRKLRIIIHVLIVPLGFM